MEELKELDRLKNVARVEAPPFLKTRIDARIQQLAEDSISSAWVWGFAATVALLVVVNGTILLRGSGSDASSFDVASSITSSMGINNLNQLYND